MSNNHKNHRKTDTPRRPLKHDFTNATFRQAQLAKRRSIRKQRRGAYFSIKKPLYFIRTVSGAAISLMVIATGSVGVYALTNWFGGAPTVTQDASVMHLDISSCKGNLPSGFEPTDDRHNLTFKITGSPHISAQDLQRQLLTDCEFNAVNEFYNPGKTYSYRYDIMPATIMDISNTTVSVKYRSPIAPMDATRTLTLDGKTLYDEGKATNLADFHAGDHIVMAITYDDSIVPEGVDAFAAPPVQSIFKTQYDLSKASGTSKGVGLKYDNIVPLDEYGKPTYK